MLRTAEEVELRYLRATLVSLSWKWSSTRQFAAVSGEDPERVCGLRIDRVPLPFDVHTRV